MVVGASIGSGFTHFGSTFNMWMIKSAVSSMQWNKSTFHIQRGYAYDIREQYIGPLDHFDERLV